MPRHTIITANYNYGRFLERAADSVMRQSVQDWEWILCDDGSIDGSLAIIESLAKRFPDKIIAQTHENLGQGESFNRAIAEARGEYVSFLDSDDWWLPNKLEWLEDAIKLMPDAAIYQHNLEIWHGERFSGRSFRCAQDWFVSGNYFAFTQQMNKQRLYFPSFAPTTGLSFKRSVLEKVVPIPREFRVSADGFMTRAGFVYGSVYSSYESLGGYRQHEENAVLGNGERDRRRHRRELLYPSLNDYYAKRSIALNYRSEVTTPVSELIRSWIHRKLIHSFMPQSIVEPGGLSVSAFSRLRHPQKVLAVRSDRNAAAVEELPKALLLDQVDWIVSENVASLFKSSPLVGRVFVNKVQGNLSIDSIAIGMIEEIRKEAYDLVVYTNATPGDRRNIRKFCRAIGAPWMGYEGSGHWGIENIFDIVRLSRMARTLV